MTESNMWVIHGIGAGRGSAIAPLVFVRPRPEVPVDEPTPVDPDAAAQSVRDALTAVASDLREHAADATGSMAEVLAATAAMAADPALAIDATRRVMAGSGPATAVDDAVAGFVTAFEAAGGYLAERVTDLHSVRDRVVARLLGVAEPGLILTQRSVVAAEDLSPADTAGLDASLVAAIVTQAGGATGHTAIIAGQLGIPCVVRASGIMKVAPGTEIAVESGSGTVTVAPSSDVRLRVEQTASREAALAADSAPGATRDGHRVALLANIGGPDDVPRALAAQAEGVGLFRTEVLFLERDTAPSEEEQQQVYDRTLAALAGRKLVVRTLDAGADKPLAFAQQDEEDTPALGVRGFRLARTMPDLIDTQLSALGAVAQESMWVMAPMVSTPAEARDFASRARDAGVSTVGVMVEVPAAALKAEAILAEVDFVSLGTNDLSQYTMASDRLRGELSDLLDPWQPAVLELVAHTAAAGLHLGKPVGVCGQSAADPAMALVLVGLGVTSLSMAPGSLAAVRTAIRAHTREQCREIASDALAAANPAEARQRALDRMEPGCRALLGLS